MDGRVGPHHLALLIDEIPDGACRQERQEQQQEMPAPAQHADTVSPRVDECQESETVVVGSERGESYWTRNMA